MNEKWLFQQQQQQTRRQREKERINEYKYMQVYSDYCQQINHEKYMVHEWQDREREIEKHTQRRKTAKKSKQQSEKAFFPSFETIRNKLRLLFGRLFGTFAVAILLCCYIWLDARVCKFHIVSFHSFSCSSFFLFVFILFLVCYPCFEWVCVRAGVLSLCVCVQERMCVSLSLCIGCCCCYAIQRCALISSHATAPIWKGKSMKSCTFHLYLSLCMCM